jgi:soluble lytic murein transglycosylase-like protein
MPRLSSPSLAFALVAAAPLAFAAQQPIPAAYAEVATAAGMPAEAVYALAVTGSGTRLSDGCTRPWPWTLSVDGRTERYPSRAEAHAALSKALAQGATKIRIGLLQLDWQRHKQYLGAAWTALDPYRNLQIGAALLKTRYRDKGWKDALTRYAGSRKARVGAVLDKLLDAKTDLCKPGYEPDAAPVIPESEWGTVAQWVNAIAPRYGVDPQLVLAVIRQESGFNPKAHSHKQAQGLMQLIPATAARFGVDNPWNPRENIRGGVAYLNWLLRRYHGDVALALAGYNAGENAVDQYGGIPPYRETRNYVQRILSAYPKTTHPIPTAALADDS